MQQTIDPTSAIVAQAKNYFERFSERLLQLFAFVPDEKLTWTPSPTAKSSLRLVAHCALTSRFYANVITGNLPERMPTPGEFVKDLNEAEEKITTRESAVALVKETTVELCKAMDTVNARNINATPNSPFGPMPMQFWLYDGGDQMAVHGGQVAYLQTIWGDLDNHFG